MDHIFKIIIQTCKVPFPCWSFFERRKRSGRIFKLASWTDCLSVTDSINNSTRSCLSTRGRGKEREGVSINEGRLLPEDNNTVIALDINKVWLLHVHAHV